MTLSCNLDKLGMDLLFPVFVGERGISGESCTNKRYNLIKHTAVKYLHSFLTRDGDFYLWSMH